MMRITDFIFIIWQVALLGLLLYNQLTEKKLRTRLLLISIAFLTLHLTTEKAHWQMSAAYVTFLLTTTLLLRPLYALPRSRAGRVGRISLMLILTLSMLIPMTLFPVFSLPSPSGPYLTGTKTFQLTDKRQGEVGRHLTIHAYYPSQKKTAKMLPYQTDAAKVMKNMTTAPVLPSFMYSHLALIKTHTYLDAKPLVGNFPVLLYSSGIKGHHSQNTFQLVELASRGYVVLSIENDDVGELTSSVPDYENQPIISQYSGALSQLVTDFSFIINTIEESNHFSDLRQIMDTKRIGAMGYGSGGVAAIRSAKQDPRIKAVISLDGYQRYPLHAIGSHETPVLSIYSSVLRKKVLEDHYFNISDTTLRYFNELQEVGPNHFELTLFNTNQLSFSDLSAFSALVTESGSDPFSDLQEINRLSLAFLQDKLNEEFVLKKSPQDQNKKAIPSLNFSLQRGKALPN